jgi:hypothetical protein
VTADEARGLLAESEQPPTVRWIDKHSRWRYGRLAKVGTKWATIETGGGDLPTYTYRVEVEKIRVRRKA